MMPAIHPWSSKKAGKDQYPEVVYKNLEVEGQKLNPRNDDTSLYKVSLTVLALVTLCVCLTTSMLAYSIYLTRFIQKAEQSQQVIIENLKVTLSNTNKDSSEEGPHPSHSKDDKLPWLVKPKDPQCTVDESSRFDCWPEYVGATQDKCTKRGCCWKPATTKGAPYCYFPSNFPGYTASNVATTASGVKADLTRTGAGIFPPDIKKLKLEVDFQSESRLRVKIYDPANARFEPPMDLPKGAVAVKNPQYKVNITKAPFGITVTRASTGAIVFDTTGQAPFTFADQFLQIGTKLSTKYLYGLGEHRYNFLQELSWRKLVFWARDSPLFIGTNGYGSHPFFLNLEPQTGNKVPNAHGVLLLNSNAGDVALQPAGKAGGITYRFTGGILDFYMLLGDSPLSVSAQYTNLVGLPYMPPFWSLGFHLCKYGYGKDTELQKIIARNRQAKMPYDVQWTDIDYMDNYKDWTYSPDNFKNLPNIIKDLHDNKQRYVIMADPAISSSQPAGSYPPFDDGKKLGTFVQKSTGGILIGKVWPGETAFPDFFHPNAYSYWYKQAKTFHDKIQFDGLWIDMNEPSSFIDGSTSGCDPNSKFTKPPFTPGSIDGGSLVSKTICPSAKHSLSAHYNLHNMYGWSQSNISRGALNTIYGNKRSPLISRSSFVGSGRYTGHWLGDNFSKYEDLAYSIAGILNFNLFGIPLIGADICGFLGDTNPELCNRWHQLGAFYPFMRNHADIHAKDQDPASFQAPYVDNIRKALQLRYQLLAVLYTSFFNAHTKGLPIIRPLFYIYPGTEAIAHQFMWTDQLLVSPVVSQGATSVQAFIPKDTFYDYYTGVTVLGQGKNVSLNAPLDTINVHIRGGSILPLLPATQRTDDSRKEKFNIVVAPSTAGNASGELFWDDGESSDSISSKKYSLIKFSFAQKTIKATAAVSGYSPTGGIPAGQVSVFGVQAAPSQVKVNGQTGTFKYDGQKKILAIDNLTVDLLKPLTITYG